MTLDLPSGTQTSVDTGDGFQGTKSPSRPHPARQGDQETGGRVTAGETWPPGEGSSLRAGPGAVPTAP